MGASMIEYVLLSLPSFVAGGFALAWWQSRPARRQNAVLRAAVAEAVREPEKFQARVGGTRAGRDSRIAAIQERRKAARAQRKAE